MEYTTSRDINTLIWIGFQESVEASSWTKCIGAPRDRHASVPPPSLRSQDQDGRAQNEGKEEGEEKRSLSLPTKRKSLQQLNPLLPAHTRRRHLTSGQ